jgi:O-antigen/teichoic acid export membrane protein
MNGAVATVSLEAHPEVDERLVRVSHTRRLAINIWILCAGQGAYWLGKFLGQLVLSRMLSPGSFDQCCVYLSTAAAVATVIDLGLNVTCLNYSARLGTSAKGAIWGRFLTLRLLLIIGVSTSALAFSGAFCGLVLGHSEFALAFRLGCVSAAVSAMASFVQTLLQSEGHFGRIAYLNAIAAGLYFPPLFLAVRLGVPALAALFLCDIASRLIPCVGGRRVLRAAVTGWQEAHGAPAVKEIAGFASWVTLSTVAGAFTSYLPIVLLSRSSGIAELGNFSLGCALAGGFSLLLNATMTVTLPEAAKAQSRRQRFSYLRTFVPPIAAGAALLTIPLGFSAPLLSLVLGPAHQAAIPVFRALALGQLVLLVANPVQFLLYSWKRPDLCTAVDLFIAVGFTALCFLFGPSLGAHGVALGLLCVQAGAKFLVCLCVALVILRPEYPVTTGGLRRVLPSRPR